MATKKKTGLDGHKKKKTGLDGHKKRKQGLMATKKKKTGLDHNLQGISTIELVRSHNLTS